MFTLAAVPYRAAGFTLAFPVFGSNPDAQFTVTHGSAEMNWPVIRSITSTHVRCGMVVKPKVGAGFRMPATLNHWSPSQIR